MSRIVLITGTYPTYDRFGIKNGEEFVVSHGISDETLCTIPLPNVHPREFPGAYYDNQLGEWVMSE